MPLGERGLYWLKVRAANAAGHDKKKLADRVAWADENQELIKAAANDPCGNLWWAEQEDCWALLATCTELAAAWDLPNCGSEFLSRLPIPLDCTCSGVQHFAGLTLAFDMAAKVNLTTSDEIADIYRDVAELVFAELVKADHYSAAVWRGVFSIPKNARKLCKVASNDRELWVRQEGGSCANQKLDPEQRDRDRMS